MTHQLALDFFVSAKAKPAKLEIVKHAPVVRDRRRTFLVTPRTGREILIRRGSATKPGSEEPKYEIPEPTYQPCPVSEHPIETIRLVTRKAEELYGLTHDWASFRDGLNLIEATLSRFQPGGEERYMENVKRLGSKGATKASEIFAILLNHFTYQQQFGDVLGPVYQNLASMGARSILGQYFTPWSVAVAMAQMTLIDLEKREAEEKRPITVCDPCCGSGVMLLAAKAVIASRRGREALKEFAFYGQDIDPICVAMCRIQMRL
ncbi:MAG: N-6 DNA methylase, partial [Pseudomonadota bacterium]